MLPTLHGRIQTRIIVLALVGGLVTLAVTPMLRASAPLPTLYRTTFTVLLVVIVLGVAWEFLYHLLQQFRWEKDWPTPFGLITGINEGLLTWAVVQSGLLPVEVTLANFLIDFSAVWLITWIWVNGPMRVLTVRWRFSGGRLI